MKTMTKKPLGLLLAVVMLVSSIPVIALSASGNLVTGSTDSANITDDGVATSDEANLTDAVVPTDDANPTNDANPTDDANPTEDKSTSEKIKEVEVAGTFVMKNGFATVKPGYTVEELIALFAAKGYSAVVYQNDEAVEGAIATGMILIVDGNTEDSCELVTIGDVDGNADVDVKDAREALRAAVALVTLDGAKKAAASIEHDIDADVSVKDARLILRAAVELEKPADWLKTAE